MKQYWGFSSFKPMQEEIISSVLNGKDTVALLPTSGGKSICFQIPALVNEGICIVISPLVALMTDQVNSLKKHGIKALAIVGGKSFNDLSILLDNAIYGNYKFLYLSPERLQQEMVQLAIKKMSVNLIAVDEAHCISQWGNDFRPSYQNINILRGLHPLVPYIALTATATPEVLKDTIIQLKLELPNIFKNSFIRDNLSYQVHKSADKLYRIQQLLKDNKQSAIVYVRSRKSAVSISNELNSYGIPSTYYHGGIEPEKKRSRLDKWIKGEISVMVATNAFGMGIDHSHVRFVIHIQLPESLESYFQEAGRAGRDGKMASAILLYNDHDKVLVKKQFIDSRPTVKDLKKIYGKLNSYFQIPYGEGVFTEYSFNFIDFCATYKLDSLLIYNGLAALDRLGIIQLSKQFGRKSILKFVISSEKILHYFEQNISSAVIGKTILRLYGGIFEAPTTVNMELIASKTGQSVETIISLLYKMEQENILELTLHTTDATITVLVPREDDKTINRISKEIIALNLKKEKEVASVLQYVDNNRVCKSIQLVEYFGETNAKKCGICSVCDSTRNSVHKKEALIISEKIIQLLKDSEMSSREISEKLTFTETKIVFVLQLLLDTNRIKFNTKNQYHLIQ